MPPLKQSPLVKNYLLLYNGIQLLVWTCGLISTFFSFLKWEISPANWKIPFVFFGIGHCVMILETVHALIGIVRSGWLANAIQVMSRLLVNSFFFWIGKDVIGWWTVMMAFSWGFAEVIRYLHNFTKVLMKTPPRIIGIIRYTAFIPLYPLGYSGETITCFDAIFYFKNVKDFGISLPNSLNASISAHFLVFTYVIGSFFAWPTLYAHMFRQRKKFLNPSQSSLNSTSE